MAETDREFLLLEDCAREYPVALGTLRDWRARGLIRTYKPGRRVLVRRSEFEAFLAKHAEGPSAV